MLLYLYRDLCKECLLGHRDVIRGAVLVIQFPKGIMLSPAHCRSFTSKTWALGISIQHEPSTAVPRWETHQALVE